MKTLVEKLPLVADTSFLAEIFTTPAFEVPWHQHIEYELIYFIEGDGMAFIGNYAGEFQAGDVFFIGKNIAHTFQKSKSDLLTSALVVQFREDFWGQQFIDLPELKSIQQLLQQSSRGLQVQGPGSAAIAEIMQQLVHLKGIARIIKLCECLQLLQENEQNISLSTQESKQVNDKEKERIDKVFHYTIESFKDHIALNDVAAIAGMTPPAFCHYFKKSTKKTYIDFLNEIRIGYACKQLIDTDQTVLNICYDSGFNTLANFNKQFLKVKKTTPSQYRRVFNMRNSVVEATNE